MWGPSTTTQIRCQLFELIQNLRCGQKPSRLRGRANGVLRFAQTTESKLLSGRAAFTPPPFAELGKDSYFLFAVNLRTWEILDPIPVVNVCFRQVVSKYSDYSAKISFFVCNDYACRS